MPLIIQRNDITKMQVDAIVNAAKSTLMGGGGVDGAIHKAAGPGLLEECKTLGGCMPGMAKITKGYNLPSKYVIHTVGPVYENGNCGESEVLASCYRQSLALAEKYNFETVAFPLISSGAYGYPKGEAMEIATKTVKEYLLDSKHEMTVYLVVFDSVSFRISLGKFVSIAEYIDDNYSGLDCFNNERRRRDYESEVLCQSAPMSDFVSESKETLLKPCANVIQDFCEAPKKRSIFTNKKPEKKKAEAVSLADMLGTLDESFSQMLLRKIDEKGMTDAQCYKKANVDRKLFSKIRSDVNYRPSKPTAIAFAIALELPFGEFEDMLKKAGFAISHSNKFDIIIEYFVRNENYDIFEINEALFAFDQNLLGA